MQRDTLTQEPYRSEVRPQQEEDTIDLLELCMGLLDHWKFIAVAAAAGAVLAVLYTFLLVTPLYKATSTIYVVSRNDSVLNLSDIQIGSALTSDYIKVFEMWEVHEKVISALDLDYTYTQMDNMLSVTNANDTRMLDITVPANPFSPSKTKNILLGFLAGFVLSCGVVVLRVLLDDTYKSAEEIRKYTGMVVLASVPLVGGTEPKKGSNFQRRMKRLSKDIRRRVGGTGRKA